MASGGGGKVNWRAIGWLVLIGFLMYTVPQLHPANLANSLTVFAHSLSQDMQQSGG